MSALAALRARLLASTALPVIETLRPLRPPSPATR